MVAYHRPQINSHLLPCSSSANTGCEKKALGIQRIFDDFFNNIVLLVGSSITISLENERRTSIRGENAFIESVSCSGMEEELLFGGKCF